MSKADVSTLMQAVDKAASEAGRSLALLLTVCLVFLATVIETTHQDIFLNTSKPLPQIGTRLPLIGIFVVVPLAIAILHVVAVLQVRGLIVRVRTLFLALAAAGSRPPDALPPSLLVQWIVGRQTGGLLVRFLMSLLVIVVLVVIPLGTLLAAQIRFLPYHSEGVTWLHRGLIAVDVVALFTIFALGMRPLRARASGPRLGLQPSVPWGIAGAVVATAAVGWSLVLATVPDEPLERRMIAVARWLDATPVAAVVSQGAETAGPTCRPDAPRTWFRTVRLPPAEHMAAQPPAGDGRDSREMVCAVFLLAENPATSPLYFRRNLVLREARFSGTGPSEDVIRRLGEAEAWRSAASAIVITGRDLRYADLTGAHLRGVNLRGADLKGADLSHARLDFADLGDIRADLVGGCLQPPTQGEDTPTISYCSTRLTHANLDRAHLHGTNFWKARLDSVILTGASLHGADLRHVDLQRTDLSSMNLTGVDLSGANLLGAKLAGVDVRGASLFGAKLDHSILDGGRLDGADLRYAEIWVSDPSEDALAELKGPSAAGADMRHATILLGAAFGAMPSRPTDDDASPHLSAEDLVVLFKERTDTEPELSHAQLQDAYVFDATTDPPGRFLIADDLQEQALAARLASLACTPDRPGVVVGVAQRIVEASSRDIGTDPLRYHEYLLAQRLQRRDCHAAVVLDDRALCGLDAFVRRFEGLYGPEPDGTPAEFALNEDNRRALRGACPTGI